MQNHIFYYRISCYNQFVAKNAKTNFPKSLFDEKITRIDFKLFPRQKYGSRDSRKIVKNQFRDIKIFNRKVTFFVNKKNDFGSHLSLGARNTPFHWRGHREIRREQTLFFVRLGEP